MKKLFLILICLFVSFQVKSEVSRLTFENIVTSCIKTGLFFEPLNEEHHNYCECLGEKVNQNWNDDDVDQLEMGGSRFKELNTELDIFVEECSVK